MRNPDGIEGLSSIRGRPWEWNLEEGVESRDLCVRRLTEEEKQDALPKTFGHEARICRLQLRREDLLEHGFTEQCLGCQALLRGASRQGQRIVPRPDAGGHCANLFRSQPGASAGGEGEPDDLPEDGEAIEAGTSGTHPTINIHFKQLYTRLEFGGESRSK